MGNSIVATILTTGCEIRKFDASTITFLCTLSPECNPWTPHCVGIYEGKDLALVALSYHNYKNEGHSDLFRLTQETSGIGVDRIGNIQLKVPGFEFPRVLGFCPDGRYLTCATSHKIFVWEMARDYKSFNAVCDMLRRFTAVCYTSPSHLHLFELCSS